MRLVTLAPIPTSVSADTPTLQLIPSGSTRQPLALNSTSITSTLVTMHATQKLG